MLATKILIVEDNSLLRQEIRDLLRGRGFAVTEAENGIEGLRCAVDERPHIILTDVIMPELDGIDEILSIRASWPSARIIAMSGGGRTRNLELLSLAQGAGADAVIAKPVRATELLKAIVDCLNGKQPTLRSRASDEGAQ